MISEIINKMSTTQKIDMQRLPRHIAIIMDGNGRWAKKHSLGRVSGHKKGAEAVRETVTFCREIGIEYLTLYAFSAENWLRPEREVNALMRLLQEFLQSELKLMLDNNIRLMTIGDRNTLPARVVKILDEVLKKTADNNGMKLILALSYGGRDEIAAAARQVALECLSGKIVPSDINKEMIPSYLYTVNIPDPDLLIRTSGEFRISNFLLWQTAYTEFYFTPVLWPDFRKKDLIDAIMDFQKRERRFGLLSDQLPGD